MKNYDFKNFNKFKCHKFTLEKSRKKIYNKYNYYHKIKSEILIFKPENICYQYYPKINCT